jgi:hypothetical protein
VTDTGAEVTDTTNNIETLADALPKEMARVREVLGHYREIGPAGAIGAAFIEQDLRAADRAVMSGDVLAMIQALNTLRGITG